MPPLIKIYIIFAAAIYSLFLLVFGQSNWIILTGLDELVGSSNPAKFLPRQNECRNQTALSLPNSWSLQIS